MQSRMPESTAICRAKNGAGVVKHLNNCFTCLLNFNRQFYLNFTSVLTYLKALFICLFWWEVVDDDAQDPSPVPTDFGEGFLGRHDEPSSQLHHLILDILPPGR